jgi:hypothetical protein
MKPRIKTTDVRWWQDSRRYGYCLVALAMFIPPIITIAVWGICAWIYDQRTILCRMFWHKKPEAVYEHGIYAEFVCARCNQHVEEMYG